MGAVCLLGGVYLALCDLIGVLNHVSRTPSRAPVERTPSEAGDMNEVRGLPVHSGVRAVDRKRSWTSGAGWTMPPTKLCAVGILV